MSPKIYIYIVLWQVGVKKNITLFRKVEVEHFISKRIHKLNILYLKL
jgi:hypothetical protein